jgi:hypothetical protein
MTTIHPEAFAMLCFLVLMENGQGISDKSPVYIGEKMYLLKHGIEAFGALDIHNMRKVKAWCDKWHIEMPKECQKYLEESEKAYAELQARGFEL